MKKNILRFCVGIILTIYPVYHHLLWVYIFENHIDLPQLEKIEKFNEFFFSFLHGRYIGSIVPFVFAILAIFLFFYSTNLKYIILKIFKYVFIVVNILSAFLFIWSLM